ncbi:MAG: hypothetical protein A3K18_08420 [Lentisphaerae bacterium RIFOXYA12_64_32]|nr:MAG: hypothetical protein A3K18_08420 [Lentisphaerae bacterium RIFOXYA12_64_32]
MDMDVNQVEVARAAGQIDSETAVVIQRTAQNLAKTEAAAILRMLEETPLPPVTATRGQNVNLWA